MKQMLLSDSFIKSEKTDNERIGFCLATKSDQKNEIYKLRYKVYVEEFHESLQTADHIGTKVKDGLDESGLHLYSCLNKKVVAACRLNILNIDYFEDYSLYSLHLLPIDSLSNVAVISHLVVEMEYRNRGIAKYLMRYLYSLSLLHNCKFAVVACSKYLNPFYSRFGFMSYGESHHHPEKGWLSPMYLELQNEPELININFPFYDLFEAHKNSLNTVYIN